LESGDDTLRRQALQDLRQHDEQAWAAAPTDAIDALLKALTGQPRTSFKQPSAQKEAATILGNMGPRSQAAVPQLIDWLALQIILLHDRPRLSFGRLP
jgi:hypothetical protein